MKITFLSLFLFLFVYRATSQILDTDGNLVRNGHAQYYLIPVGNSGGLAIKGLGDDNQHEAVVLNPYTSPGLPVRFTNPVFLLHINEELLLNIDFPIFDSSHRYWNVSEEYPVGWAVNVSESTSFVGPFKIKQAGNYYKIVYYHDPSDESSGADIGIVKRKGLQLLAVKNGHPFEFQIKKVTESSSKAGMSIV